VTRGGQQILFDKLRAGSPLRESLRIRAPVEMTIREGEFAGNMVMRRAKEQAE
jgi:hypothetical protein